MPTPTYDLIEEKVLGSAQASVTFSSIPGTYKDLVLETIVGHTSDNYGYYAKFNSDSGSNYSVTNVWGDGAQARSYRASNATHGIALSYYVTPGTSLATITTTHIMSYANTNVNKTCLSRASREPNGTYTGAEAIVSLWRSTSAITSIAISSNGGTTMISGSTFRLWGVSG